MSGTSTRVALVLFVLSLVALPARTWGLEFPGPEPGKATASIQHESLVLENDAIACSWALSGAHLKPSRVMDKLLGNALDLGASECFEIVLGDGRIVNASDLELVKKPAVKKLRRHPNASRLAERFSGWELVARLASPDGNLEVEWHAVLRDGSNSVRQVVRLTAHKEPVELKELVVLDFPAPQARVAGNVDGSPVVAGNMFFALEHPMSKSQVAAEGNTERVRCSLPRNIALEPGKPLEVSSVVGVVPNGQLRRAFNYYVERERAHPYRPFLHYNSWFDIAWHTKKMTEAECLASIEAFGRELTIKRGVTLDSFVFDDGWDDNASLWQFHSGFPRGFTPLRKAARRYGAALGTWMSPWGGYSTAGDERLKYGKEHGFEMFEGRFALSGPKYYARFRDVCVRMIKKYGVNYFKFDGVGAGAGGNVDALLRLTNELRGIKPDLFLNITIGTWPSPFWLWFGDSTWRAGGDTGAYGKGSGRQQWITYRDWQTYQNVVAQAPLYPLSSIMLHGIVFAQYGEAEVIPKNVPDLVDEIHTYFGAGTHLQELYITAEMMTDEAWDALAETVTWSHANADVLVDTHWVGGNPGEGQVYGWASWSPRKGILVLRNPDDKAQSVTLDVGQVFELPEGAPQTYTLKSPWKSDADDPTVEVTAGTGHTFELKPFEVVVLDAQPGK